MNSIYQETIQNEINDQTEINEITEKIVALQHSQVSDENHFEISILENDIKEIIEGDYRSGDYA